MEVRQPDGQNQTATINKLTDQSTYTVGKFLAFFFFFFFFFCKDAISLGVNWCET